MLPFSLELRKNLASSWKITMAS